MRDAELIKVFNRRALIVSGGELFLFSILAGRLYQLQILDSEKYKKLSEKNSVRIKFLPPPRGIITDRFDVEMAVNVNNYGIQMIPEEVTAQGLSVEEIAQTTGTAVGTVKSQLFRGREKLRQALKGDYDGF